MVKTLDEENEGALTENQFKTLAAIFSRYVTEGYRQFEWKVTVEADRREPYLRLVSKNDFKSGREIGKLTIKLYVTKLEPAKFNPNVKWFLFLDPGIDDKLISHYKFPIEDTRPRALGNLARYAFGALKKVLERVSPI